jgi:hypothetical protein
MYFETNSLKKIFLQIRDCDFDELEKRYSHLTRFIQLFASDSQNFRKQLHDTVICQFNVAQNVADLYRSVFFRARFIVGKISKVIFNLAPSSKKQNFRLKRLGLVIN